MSKENKFVKLNARVVGKNVIISKDSFEHILLCLCSQKFIGELPVNGDSMAAMANDPKKYKNDQKEMQDTIDDVWKQGMDLIHK